MVQLVAVSASGAAESVTCTVVGLGPAYDRDMAAAFGEGLRRWRTFRGMSQLDLASAADVSQRHISFLETGRSKPSRDMVLHLARTLEVPSREQNVLLMSAGHPPVFPETELRRLGGVWGAIESMLDGHEPNMAVVVDRRWNVVAANEPGTRFLAWAFPVPRPWSSSPPNVMHMMFHPDGLRTAMADWECTAAALMHRLTRDVALHPTDPELAQLVEEVHRYPGIDGIEQRLRPSDTADPVLTTSYLIDGVPVSLFTMTTVVAAAHDLTLSELRIQASWPIDATSSERWNRRFG